MLVSRLLIYCNTRRTYIAACRQDSTPVHSKTASTSLPSFSALASSATSFANASFSSIFSNRFIGTMIFASANLFVTAKLTRSSWISAIMTRLAPVYLAMAAQRRPTAPAPNMRTVLEGARAARRVPWIATPRGSRMAPRSGETLDGNLEIYIRKLEK